MSPAALKLAFAPYLYLRAHDKSAAHVRLFAGLRRLSLRQNLLTDASAVSRLASAPRAPYGRALAACLRTLAMVCAWGMFASHANGVAAEAQWPVEQSKDCSAPH